MAELSARHHYIPRFLIENFSDDNNLLWVYDKEKKQIIKNQRSPKAIFFEWDRNLFDVNGAPGDNLEKMYGAMDDLLSKTLAKIISTHGMNGPELTLMILLASMMKWRIPKVDEDFRTLTKDIPIENLGMAIRPRDPNIKADPAELKKIAEMDIVKETKRLLLPLQPLLNSNNLDELHRNCFITSSNQFPALLGDCPIIEAPNTDFETLGDFIFPLSSNETLVCKRNTKKAISNPIFYAQKDLAIFHLSEKYVACKSRDYLERIAQTYEVLERTNKAHTPEKYIFEFIA